MSRASGTEGYGETADALAKHYESVSFADVHREILHLIPATPSRALDVGAGTGRDAAALAALGHAVVAVEPTPELRAHGQRLPAQQRSSGSTTPCPTSTRSTRGANASISSC